MSNLDAAALLAAAKAETGLSDWSDLGFVERFGLAVDLINSAAMDNAGQQAAIANCHWLLTDRLRFFDDHKRFELGKEIIDRPLFVTGDGPDDAALRTAWHAFCDQLRAAGDLSFKDQTPPPP